VSVYALSIHADYKCRHSGACCTADWDVPVELPIYRGLTEALSGHRLAAATNVSESPFITEPDLPDEAAAILSRTPGGDCVFFHRSSGLCVVHRDLGESALPATCRHFPRIAVRDRRGTFITLSHYCPTAAAMLFREDVPLAVVESPLAFPEADYEGLTVDPEAWPPLLRPRMLMDLEGYTAWECHMVRRCADEGRSPESVVATLARDATAIRAWKPGAISLTDAIADLPGEWVEARPHHTLGESLVLFGEAMKAVPSDLRPEPEEDGLDAVFESHVRPAWEQWRRPIRQFVAAKAFASWTAYQGRGLLSVVRGLEAALAILRVEAARQCRDGNRALDRDVLLQSFRAVDFVLNHLATGDELARSWSRVEKQTSAPAS
jgi:Fe-S-cluster containining protein